MTNYNKLLTPNPIHKVSKQTKGRIGDYNIRLVPIVQHLPISIITIPPKQTSEYITASPLLFEPLITKVTRFLFHRLRNLYLHRRIFPSFQRYCVLYKNLPLTR